MLGHYNLSTRQWRANKARLSHNVGSAMCYYTAPDGAKGERIKDVENIQKVGRRTAGLGAVVLECVEVPHTWWLIHFAPTLQQREKATNTHLRRSQARRPIALLLCLRGGRATPHLPSQPIISENQKGFRCQWAKGLTWNWKRVPDGTKGCICIRRSHHHLSLPSSPVKPDPGQIEARTREPGEEKQRGIGTKRQC
jgi:hypothetical protein